MQDSKPFAAAGLRCALAGIAMAVAAAVLATSPSSAQQGKGDAKGKVGTKGDTKKGPPPPPPQPGEQQPQLTYAPWTKVCQQPPDGSAKRVCFTGKDGRVESGMPVVAAVVIEPEGEARRILRVTLPLGMTLQHGTRVIVDQGQPMNAPYVVCVPTGCMADYEASGELIGKLKSGQNLVIQGINGNGQPITLMLPLAEFGKAYDGPPTDPATLGQPQAKPQ
jgi:invasion protein IalB